MDFFFHRLPTAVETAAAGTVAAGMPAAGMSAAVSYPYFPVGTAMRRTDSALKAPPESPPENGTACTIGILRSPSGVWTR